MQIKWLVPTWNSALAWNGLKQRWFHVSVWLFNFHKYFWGNPLITLQKFSERLTFLTPWYAANDPFWIFVILYYWFNSLVWPILSFCCIFGKTLAMVILPGKIVITLNWIQFLTELKVAYFQCIKKTLIRQNSFEFSFC